MRNFLLGFLLMSAVSVYSINQEADIFTLEDSSIFINKKNIGNSFSNSEVRPKYRKVKAALLAVLLGHFGVHRIYLGTSPNVPVVYSVTLGGGLGILPLIDLIAILKSKDLDEFKDSKKVFMWQKSKSTPQ
jgi:TM2 domain-containing membrane protein YozV